MKHKDHIDMSGGLEPLFNSLGEFVCKIIMIAAAIAFVVGGAIVYVAMEVLK